MAQCGAWKAMEERRNTKWEGLVEDVVREYKATLDEAVDYAAMKGKRSELLERIVPS